MKYILMIILIFGELLMADQTANNTAIAQCENKPNCISSMDQREDFTIQPLKFDNELKSSKQKLKAIIAKLPRTKLISETELTLKYEFKSLIFRFIDDVEFAFDSENKVIHMRSASRVGHSDLGANKARLELITHKFITK